MQKVQWKLPKKQLIIPQKLLKDLRVKTKPAVIRLIFLRPRLLLLLVLLVHLNIYGQIDKKKLDSLSRSIDSSTKAHRLFQDSFTKVQDSIYHSAINKNDSGKFNDFLAEQKRRLEKETQQKML